MNTPALLLISASLIAPLSAQVTFDRILHADKEPQNWLTYSGNLNGQRYSLLNQNHPGERKEPRAPVGLASQVDGEIRGHCACVQRRSLYHRGAEQCVCARPRNRADLLEPCVHALAGRTGLLRARE